MTDADLSAKMEAEIDAQMLTALRKSPDAEVLEAWHFRKVKMAEKAVEEKMTEDWYKTPKKQEERLVLQSLIFLISATNKIEVSGIQSTQLIEALRLVMIKP